MLIIYDTQQEVFIILKVRDDYQQTQNFKNLVYLSIVVPIVS